MTTFPIKIKMAQRLIDDLRECELGSYEDWQGELAEAKRTGTEPVDPPHSGTHQYEILDRRHDGVIEIRSADEACDVYYAACSGTFQIRRDKYETGDGKKDERGYRAACRICDILRPIVQETDPELVAMWRAPAGV
jgi:hypothetical protein